MNASITIREVTDTYDLVRFNVYADLVKVGSFATVQAAYEYGKMLEEDKPVNKFPNKIAVITRLRECTSLSLKESKLLTEALEYLL